MGKRQNKKAKKVNVFDLNHIKQFLDEEICEAMQKTYKLKEVKMFKLFKMFLGIIAIAVQAFAYKGTKNHYVIAAMCVVYYLSTQIIDEINRWITKNSIFLSRVKGRRVIRIDTYYEKSYSNILVLKGVRIDQPKKKSIFSMFRENENVLEKKIEVNKFFSRQGYLDKRKFSLILNELYEGVEK